MDLNEMLGIDESDPEQQHIAALVANDDELMNALIAVRHRNKRSQQDVADRLGVNQSVIARIEGGERDPHLSTLRRYAYGVGAMVSHHVVPIDAWRRTQVTRYVPDWQVGISEWVDDPAKVSVRKGGHWEHANG